MLHPEAQKRGGYTDMRKVINMSFFQVVYYVLYPAIPYPTLPSPHLCPCLISSYLKTPVIYVCVFYATSVLCECAWVLVFVCFGKYMCLRLTSMYVYF